MRSQRSQAEQRLLRQQNRTASGSIGALVIVITTCLAGPGLAHPEPEVIPDQNGALIRWYQPPGTEIVQDWDIEVTPLYSNGLPSGPKYIEAARAFPDESCWAIDEPDETAARVRVRAVSNGQHSTWSTYTVVPEPETTGSLLAAIPLLAAVAIRHRRRSLVDR